MIGLGVGGGACAEDEVGDASFALATDDTASEVQVSGWAYVSEDSSRHEWGRLIYSQARAELDGVQVDIDLELDTPLDRTQAPQVRYREVAAGQVRFDGQATAAHVQLAATAGPACPCTETRFTATVADPGPDGQVGTEDDQTRTLLDGRVYFQGPACPADEPLSLDPDEHTVTLLEPCVSAPPRSEPDASPGPPRTPRPASPQAPDRRPSPRDGTNVTVVAGGGCTCDPGPVPPGESAGGCGGDPGDSTGCEGDDVEDVEDDDSDGCGGSGCEGDDADSAACEGDSPELARLRRHPLSGPLQNYLLIGLSVMWMGRSRRA